MPVDGEPAVIVVSTVEFTVAAPPSAKALRVSLSHVYAMGDGVDIEIKARSDAGAQPILEKTILPLARTEEPRWREFDLPLPTGATHLDVKVFSKSGDSTADWIALRDFSFEQAQ